MNGPPNNPVSFLTALKITSAFVAVPLLIEFAVYLLRPEIFPRYVAGFRLATTLTLGFTYLFILFLAVSIGITFLVFKLSLKIEAMLSSLFLFFFCAIILSRALPFDSGFSPARITAFTISILLAAAACFILHRFAVQRTRLWIGLLVYCATSSFLLQHLFFTSSPFLIFLFIQPLLFFGSIYIPGKVMIPALVFAAVLLFQPKTRVDNFAPPQQINHYDRVILIGVDALSPETTFDLIKQGKLPAFQKLIENGSYARLQTLNVPFSPLVWNTIYTGTRPRDHGVMAFTSTSIAGVPPYLSLWLDNWTNSDWAHRSVDVMKKAKLFRTLNPANAKSRLKPSIWNMVNQNGAEAMVVGGWTTFPPEKIDGLFVSDYALSAKPQTPGTYYPLQKRVDDLLAYNPDTTKWPEDMRRYINRDMKVHHLASTLFKSPSPSTRFQFAYYSSPDAFGHHYGTEINMRNTSEEKRKQFLNWRNDVYQMIDRFLGDLIPLIDDRTLLIVCSDHGFRYDKRQHNYKVDGTLIIYGRNVRANTQIAADVYSIAPTVLYSLAMGSSNDFSGLALKQAFTGTIQQPGRKSYKSDLKFFEVISDQGFEEDKMQELQDLQYINR